eukprot:TRINITY_DN13930_c0_g1_i2.p1 TRINITY_DN13930_c0_g1~~TRINITY_DN13930_c0_g1_i2.p1  ORF type:complete len:610 (-),score=77.40 TRINITY_DN13930_c0_g1_i2:90-1919(-)
MPSVLSFCAIFSAAASSNEDTSLTSGDPLCPCLGLEEVRENDTSGSYGVGCGYHDTVYSVIPECSSGDPPTFCSAQWCYVDAATCQLRQRASTFGIRARDMAYSYATCGYQNSWDDVHDMGALSSLKVYMMHNSGGWKGSYCTAAETCKGPVWDLVQKAIGTTPMKVQTTFLGGPLAKYPEAFPDVTMQPILRANANETSTFDACIMATGTGFADVCIGAFADSVKRRTVSPMLELYYDDAVLITAGEEGSATPLELLFSWSRPFTPRLWGVIAITLLVISSCFAIMECMDSESLFFIGNEERRMWTFLGRLGLAWYIGLMSMMGGGSMFQGQRPSTRMANIALSFFILISISSYTARLASALVAQKQVRSLVSSWDSVLANSAIKVCATHSFRTQIVDLMSLPEKQYVPLLARSASFEGVREGAKCKAAVVALEDWEVARTKSENTRLIRVGDPLFSLSWALPVSHRASRFLEIRLSRRLVDGTWVNALKQYRPDAPETSGLNDDVAMDVEDFSGPVTFVASMVMAGFAIRMANAYLAHRATLGLSVHIAQKPQGSPAEVEQTVHDQTETSTDIHQDMQDLKKQNAAMIEEVRRLSASVSEVVQSARL